MLSKSLLNSINSLFRATSNLGCSSKTPSNPNSAPINAELIVIIAKPAVAVTSSSL